MKHKTKKQTKSMIARKNNKNRTAFVYDNRSGFEAFVSQTFKGAKQGSRLTLRFGEDRIDLNGAELRLLRGVLNTANRLAARA